MAYNAVGRVPRGRRSLVAKAADPARKTIHAFGRSWKILTLYYALDMNGDEIIRKQVGRPRGERPLVRLDRLNRGLRNLGLMPPTESKPPHVRKMVGRVGRARWLNVPPNNPILTRAAA